MPRCTRSRPDIGRPELEYTKIESSLSTPSPQSAFLTQVSRLFVGKYRFPCSCSLRGFANMGCTFLGYGRSSWAGKCRYVTR